MVWYQYITILSTSDIALSIQIIRLAPCIIKLAISAKIGKYFDFTNNA